MNKRVFKLACLLSIALQAGAQNPIIQTKFTPDPAPYVHNDTVYLFVDHDENDAQYFKMKDWMLYASTDMVNWTYRGTPMSTATFKWAKQGDNAWAAQAVERNGKWYWYICAEDTVAHTHGIGVGVANSPNGDYTDPLGHPLVPGHSGFIDPTVFIDDDGQAYLFWGNNGAWYAPLNDDMISLKQPPREVPGLNDASAFGPLVLKRDYQENRKKMKTNYEEGPWVFKRNGLYYMMYAAGGVPEHMAYSTAQCIDGPWTYRGRIMNESPNSFTIHGGIIHFKNRDFIFYHNGLLPDGGGFRRSSCVEEFKWNEDGTIPMIPFSKEGVTTPTSHLSPFARVEAETMAWSQGVTTDNQTGNEHFVTGIHEGDFIMLREVDFGTKGAKEVTIMAQPLAGGVVELHLDAPNGTLLGKCTIQAKHHKWAKFKSKLLKTTGIHQLCLVFKNNSSLPAGKEELFNLDWWQMR